MRRVFILLVLLAPVLAWAEEETTTNIIGVWQVMTPEGEAEFITIGPEGSAIHSTRGIPDSNGSWRNQDQDTIIYWQNGWTEVITDDAGVVTRRRYAPGQDHDEDPSATSKMKRLEAAPAHPKAASWGASIILENCKG